MQRVYRPHFSRGEPIVTDLREKLNKMRQEKAPHGEVGTKNPPPPDPAYSFLKDPLRGDDCAKFSHEKKGGPQNVKTEAKTGNKNKDAKQRNSSKPIERSPRGNRSANSYRSRGPPREWRNNEQNQRKFNEKGTRLGFLKQQSVNNIKVEVSSESGERRCVIDDTTKVQIPVNPKKNYTVKQKSGKWLHRGSPKCYASKNKRLSPSKYGKNEQDKLTTVAIEEEGTSSAPKSENVQTENILHSSKTKSETINGGKEITVKGKNTENEPKGGVKERKEDAKTVLVENNCDQTVVKQDAQSFQQEFKD